MPRHSRQGSKYRETVYKYFANSLVMKDWDKFYAPKLEKARAQEGKWYGNWGDDCLHVFVADRPETEEFLAWGDKAYETKIDLLKAETPQRPIVWGDISYDYVEWCVVRWLRTNVMDSALLHGLREATYPALVINREMADPPLQEKIAAFLARAGQPVPPVPPHNPLGRDWRANACACLLFRYGLASWWLEDLPGAWRALLNALWFLHQCLPLIPTGTEDLLAESPGETPLPAATWAYLERLEGQLSKQDGVRTLHRAIRLLAQWLEARRWAPDREGAQVEQLREFIVAAMLTMASARPEVMQIYEIFYVIVMLYNHLVCHLPMARAVMEALVSGTLPGAPVAVAGATPAP